MRDKRKKKKVADSTTCGFTNMQANIDAFNHNASGVGNIPGTGVGMGEDLKEDFDEEQYSVDANYVNELLKDGWKEKASTGSIFWFTKSGEDYWIVVNPKQGWAMKCFPMDERYERIKSKSVPDSDGFMTDYTMYFDHEENKYVFVFGDNDLYTPEDGYIDWECDTEDEAEDWFNGYEGFADDDLDESLKQPTKRIVEEAEDLPDISEENIIAQEDAGISSLFIDTINECWSMIDNYHSIIVTLDSLNRHEFDETLQGLLEERNKEVGALQGILEILSPASAQIEQGKEEAQEEISFDQVEEDFGLSECADAPKLPQRNNRHRVSESKKSKTISKLLKEDWSSNGKLEDFNAEDLINKAFDNKYSTYSVRDFNGKQLYINIDPGFLFGVRKDDSKIWINIVQIDGNDQERLYLDSALSQEEAVEKLNTWLDGYMNDSNGEDISTDEEPEKNDEEEQEELQ